MGKSHTSKIIVIVPDHVLAQLEKAKLEPHWHHVRSAMLQLFEDTVPGKMIKDCRRTAVLLEKQLYDFATARKYPSHLYVCYAPHTEKGEPSVGTLCGVVVFESGTTLKFVQDNWQRFQFFYASPHQVDLSCVRVVRHLCLRHSV